MKPASATPVTTKFLGEIHICVNNLDGEARDYLPFQEFHQIRRVLLHFFSDLSGRPARDSGQLI
jgi:hypothetical protein